MDVESFKSQLKAPLKAAGFRKTGSTWRRASHTSVAVLNVQKSQWGPEHYINLGVYYFSLGSDTSPPENRCHVRERAQLQATPRLVEDALAWFDSVETLEKVGLLLKAGGLRSAAVSRAVHATAA